MRKRCTGTRIHKISILTLLTFGFALASNAQTQPTLVNLQTQGRNPDFSAQPATKPMTVGTALPSSCQVGSSGGPVSPQGTAAISTEPFIGSAWRAARVTWTASSTYSGPVLIRGRQVGGGGAVGFGEGHVPYDELQLQSGSAGPPWQSFTRVRAPGCYFYQADGTSFSETIVFRAQ